MRVIKRDGVSVRVITDPSEARSLVAKLPTLNTGDPSLDFETTSLRPGDGVVRLTVIGVSAKSAYVIDHYKCGSFASFADDLLEAARYYVFNVNFEGRWFDNEVSSVTALSRRLLDVGHMRRSVRGGGPLSLATMAKMDLKIELDKTEQNGQWSNKVLTDDQYFYAGMDGTTTKRLGDYWASGMSPEQWNGFFVINETWRAVNECMDTGLKVDERYHKKLIRMWTARRDAAETAFRKYVPVEHIANIRSKKQISDFLKKLLDDDAVDSWPKTEKTSQLQTSRNILRSMSYISPYPFSRALAALMVFNRADKYLSTYGQTLLNIQALSVDGRIRSRLNMAQAITGRFSSSGPNQQNFPNAWYFRYTFMCEQGHKMILADYSGVEIRVLAELSQDAILLHDAIYDDVHSRSAIAIFKITDVEDFLRLVKWKKERLHELNDRDKASHFRYKAMRTKAKAFTFQLLYGAGAAALSLALRCSVSEAEDAIKSWASRYSKAYGYRQTMFEKMMHDGFLPCASGRTIFVHKRERSMPVAANYPVQGSAGDVMYAAMRHTQIILEERDIAARIMASVHDEMLLLSEDYCAKEAQQALKDGMIAGWLEIFPGSNTDHLVDVEIGVRWSDKA